MSATPIKAPPAPTFRDYWQLMRLDRPVGIWLLLWPTLWALWLAAESGPSLTLIAVFTLGTVVMRSAGCVINDFADRDFDPQVERTRNRPLAAGRVSSRQALTLFVGLCLLALLLAWPLNRLALLLSIPAVALAASYPFAKRYHALPQAHLGIAFSWGIPMAFAAVNGQVDWPLAGLLSAANLCWVIAYDTLYAMVDRNDDLKAGVKSSAILFGRYDLMIISALTAIAIILLGLAGIWRGLGSAYFVGLAAATGVVIRELWRARDRSREACFRAFVNNHRFGLCVLAGIVATTASRHAI